MSRRYGKPGDEAPVSMLSPVETRGVVTVRVVSATSVHVACCVAVSGYMQTLRPGRVTVLPVDLRAPRHARG
jgi:hypothetical protein